MSIPIPHRPSGYLLGDIAAQVTIDVFIDIQCPHSRLIWPTLLEVLNHYQGKSVNLKTHLITLSNHRQSWDMTLGIFAFAEGRSDKFYEFSTFLFDHQEQFLNAAFINKTHNDLKQLVSDFAEKLGNRDRTKFLERMSSHDTYIQGRTPNRYAATRGVWGTPTLFINNAGNVPVDHSSNLADWIAVIDPLLENKVY